MNVLLDTHILLWSLSEDERLSDRAKEVILEQANSLYYIVVSVWEIAIKHALRPDNVKISGKEFSDYCQQAGFLSLDLRDKHVYSLETLHRDGDVPKHNDPFNRILLSQAKTENMSFLTHDTLFQGYHENCVIFV